jgi:hypothetical protein
VAALGLRRCPPGFFVCFTALYAVGQTKNPLPRAGTRWKLDKIVFTLGLYPRPDIAHCGELRGLPRLSPSGPTIRTNR